MQKNYTKSWIINTRMNNILDLISVAPLAGISDSPFRAICRSFGAKDLYSEMVSADGLSRGQKGSVRLIQTLEEDGPMVVQLFGSKPDSFYLAAKILDELEHVKEININAGCPVKKVLKAGGGASLMKDVLLLGKIVEQVKRATNKSVSVKIRSGFDFHSINYLDCARISKEAGANKIILHPRTAKMMFSGKAEWEHISILKQMITGIKIIGNGDVLTLSDVKKMMDETSCDGVMVGRALFGNPWFLSDQPKVFNQQFVETILKHLELAIKFYGDHHAYRLMKKHLIYYVKGAKMPSSLKVPFYDAITRSNSAEEQRSIINDTLKEVLAKNE